MAYMMKLTAMRKSVTGESIEYESHRQNGSGVAYLINTRSFDPLNR
jgi:hypothetical protein